MGLLRPLGTGQGYLKAGFLGFQKTGKTWTALELALEVIRFFKLNGPIVMYDTEGGSEYIAEKVRAVTGQDLIGVRSRSFDDMLAAAQEAQAIGAAVFLADSVTHPWREMCDAFLAQTNEKKRRFFESKGWNFKPQAALEIQDWNPIKSKWAKWNDWYLNSPMHAIVCGRAGWDFTEEQDRQNPDKTKLVKSGTKMKTEGEFGFEPSLLIEMEREGVEERQDYLATVIGDRYGVINGKTFRNPTGAVFRPYLEKLVPGAHAAIDMTVKTDMGVPEMGGDDWHREKTARAILAEEVAGLLASRWPGQSGAEKKARSDAFQEYFGTRSWKALSEHTDAGKLRAGLERMRNVFESGVDPNEQAAAEEALAKARAAAPSGSDADGDRVGF